MDILPDLSRQISFFGGEESTICFHEIRRCYIDGSSAAVVLLCQTFIEREQGRCLRATLYGYFPGGRSSAATKQ